MQISLEQNGRQTELGKVTCQTKHVSKRRITELFISFMPVRRGAHYGHNIILATCQYYQKEGPCKCPRGLLCLKSPFSYANWHLELRIEWNGKKKMRTDREKIERGSIVEWVAGFQQYSDFLIVPIPTNHCTKPSKLIQSSVKTITARFREWLAAMVQFWGGQRNILRVILET